MNCSNNNNRFYLNYQFNETNIIENNKSIPFNIIIANNGFTYSNGNFIVNNDGIYLIVYHINVEGSVTTTTIKLSLAINGNAYHTTIGNAVQTQFSGSTAIKLKAGDTISLINTTGEEIELSFGNITIYN